MTGTQHSLYGLWLLDGAEVAFDDPKRLYTRGLDAGADAEASADGWSPFAAVTVHSAGAIHDARRDDVGAPGLEHPLRRGDDAIGSNRAGSGECATPHATNAFTLAPMTLDKCVDPSVPRGLRPRRALRQ